MSKTITARCKYIIINILYKQNSSGECQIIVNYKQKLQQHQNQKNLETSQILKYFQILKLIRNQNNKYFHKFWKILFMNKLQSKISNIEIEKKSKRQENKQQ
ncbi:hypothetical protein pb186bvf_014777 [Paramecium bursaria]